MADRQFVLGGTESAPADWVPPASLEIIPKTAFATFDGAGAAGAFLPCLEIISDSGHVVGQYVTEASVAAGGSVSVSWFPGGELEPESTAPPASGGITNITSSAATITVTSPAGPTTNVDLPASGVAAGTYGDATHTAQVTVGTDGIVTAASQIDISGIAGTGLVKLFDTTLGADASSIDTGANAIPTGHGCLLIYVTARSSRAANVLDTSLMTFNGDTASHYWRNVVFLGNTTLSGLQSGATPIASVPLNIYGDTGPTNAAASLEYVIPNYDGTTFIKALSGRTSVPSSTDANSESQLGSFVWNSTAAINQVTIVPGVGPNFRAGSRMQIYGVQ